MSAVIVRSTGTPMFSIEAARRSGSEFDRIASFQPAGAKLLELAGNLGERGP